MSEPASRDASRDADMASDLEPVDALAVLRTLLPLRFARRDVQAWRRATPQLTRALRVLSTEQAQLLAQEVWDQFDRNRIGFLLGQLNAAVSGALVPLHADLIAHEQFYPGWLYLGATPERRTHLLHLVATAEDSLRLDHLLKCLAWIGDEPVQAQFRVWRQTPPIWQADLHVTPDEYLVEAGWELTLEGARRDLYRQRCYELVPLGEEQPESMASDAPVETVAGRSDGASSATQRRVVGTEHEGSCPWCERRLVTLLDLDLGDGRCASVTDGGPEGTRLRIAHCAWCSAYATIYTDVDLHGRSEWSLANGAKPPILEQITDDGEPVELPARTLVLGARRRTPFEALGRLMLDELGSSQLGGHPEWIDDAIYPPCPSCGRRMLCVGQVSWEEVEEFAEGMTYAFLCLPCGKAATIYQQT